MTDGDAVACIISLLYMCVIDEKEKKKNQTYQIDLWVNFQKIKINKIQFLFFCLNVLILFIARKLFIIKKKTQKKIENLRFRVFVSRKRSRKKKHKKN